MKADYFEAMINDLRSALQVAQGRQGQSSAMFLDRRMLQKSPSASDNNMEDSIDFAGIVFF
ncbi:hypothetical protein [Burkholderia ubonensis]|uniref:hypothetical protein n=1 Tax=Burkholderia ubonensis TaxID=101571 RepID=UPI000A74869F|nr:hypothetical protein [Burkholderia ubonensis]